MSKHKYMRFFLLKVTIILFVLPNIVLAAIVPVDKFNITPLNLTGNVGVILEGEAGNRTEQDYNINGILRYGWKTQSLVWISDFNYTRIDGRKNEDDLFTHIRFIKNNYINDNVDAEFFIQYNYDDFADLSSRKLIGMGARWRLERTEGEVKYQRQFGFGAFYEDENSASTRLNNTTVRANLYAKFRYQDAAKRPFELYTTAYVQPSLQQLKDLRILVIAGVEFPITSALSFSVEAEIEHDSQPFDNVEKTNLEYGVKLSYSF